MAYTAPPRLGRPACGHDAAASWLTRRWRRPGRRRAGGRGRGSTGSLFAPGEARVSAFDRGLLYGESLFETLKVVDGAPCLWRPHVERLTSACGELGLPLDVAGLELGVRRLLQARPVALGALRIQVTGGEQPGGGRGLTAPAAGRRPRVIASVTAVSPQPAHVFERGVDVVTAADLGRPLPWLKSGSYLASVAAKMRAEKAGAFECLLVGGEPARLLEGSFSNVLVWDGRVSSPRRPARGWLASRRRSWCRRHGPWVCVTEERPVALDELWAGEARGLLLTGSLSGCLPVRGRGRSADGVQPSRSPMICVVDCTNGRATRGWSGRGVESMDPEHRFDVIIVGAGPAGIFAALELARRSSLSILLIEKGCDISERRCPARTTGHCAHCDPCDITCGWGGAGAFSDGKLTLSPEVGGWLGEYLGPARAAGGDHRSGSPLAGVRCARDPLRHRSRAGRLLADQGSDAPPEADRFAHPPHGHRAVRRGAGGHAPGPRRPRASAHRHAVAQLTVESRCARAGAVDAPAAARRVTGVVTDSGEEFESPVVILAPGREGAAWLKDEAGRLGLSVTSNAVDIGVRVEVPAVFTDAITADLYEPKLLYRSAYFEDPVRTFCMNPHGVVSTESYGDVVTVNGHSYADHEQRTLSTNFALLVSTRFTQPFNDPIAYGKSIARLANLLGSDVIVQRLVDLQAGRRTTPERLARCSVPPTLSEASPGDLSFALPYRHQRDIFDMLEALDGCCPEWPAGHAPLRGGGQVLLVATGARPRPADNGGRPLRRRRRRGSHPGVGAGLGLRVGGGAGGAAQSGKSSARAGRINPLARSAQITTIRESRWPIQSTLRRATSSAA